jgi:hypothetical protein
MTRQREVEVHQRAGSLAGGIGEFTDLDGVVGTVLEVGGDVVVEKAGLFAPGQGVDHRSLWASGLFDPLNRRFDIVDVGNGVAVGISENLALQFVEFLIERVEQREVRVDDRIEDGVSQVVGPGGANASTLVSETVSDRIEDVPAEVFLKGDHNGLALDDADLFDGDGVIVRAGHQGHQKEAIFDDGRARSLRYMLNIFEYQTR